MGSFAEQEAALRPPIQFASRGGGGSDGPGQKTSGNVQRKEADESLADSAGSGTRALSDLDRVRLESETGDRIGIAFTNYVDACNDHINALKAAAAESRDLLLVVADVALGLIAPGGGRALASLMNMLPVKAPESVYRVAITLMDSAGPIVSSVLNGGKRAAGMAMGSALRQTEDEAFIGTLKDGFAIAAQDVRAGLPTRSDAEVLLVCAAFDARIATRSAYSERIGKLVAMYKQQVKPIGSSRMVEGPEPWRGLGPLIGTEGLVSVDGGGAPRLVRVRLDRRGGEKPTMHFVSFVSPEMKAAATTKANNVQPRGIQTVPGDMIKGLPKGGGKP